MSETLSTSISTGIELNSQGDPPPGGLPYQSPFTITQSGIINDIHDSSGAYPNAIYADSAVITNYGTVEASESNGIYIRGDGYVENFSTISGQFGVEFRFGTIANIGSAALISGRDSGAFAFGFGTFFNTGTIIGSNDSGIAMTGGFISNSSAGALIRGGDTGVEVLSVGNTTTILNAGTIYGGAYGIIMGNSGTVENSGLISGRSYSVNFDPNDTQSRLIIAPGAVFDGRVGDVSSASTSNNSATLEFATGACAGDLSGIGTEFAGFGTIAIDTGATWFLGGDLAGLADGQTISGFATGDTLDVINFAATGRLYDADSGLVLSNATGSVTLDLTGDFSTGDFSIQGDGSTGTLIEEVTCFAKGTRIATAQGEIAVEALKIGDLVPTLHAGLQKVKWIGTSSYSAPFSNHAKVLPVCIKAGALAERVPARDLFVSPGHAICFDGVLVHASLLVNGFSIVQAKSVERIEYFHIELTNHEVVLAENCPAESFVGEYFRAAFHNAADYARLYPGQGAPAHHCLPYLSSGFELAAIQRRLRARSGMAEGPVGMGALLGYVDSVSETRVCGWAQSAHNPDGSVCLDMFAGETRIGRVLANSFRQDLKDAGIGAGNHGFEWALSRGARGKITVRRSGDKALLGFADCDRVAAEEFTAEKRISLGDLCKRRYRPTRSHQRWRNALRFSALRSDSF